MKSTSYSIFALTVAMSVGAFASSSELLSRPAGIKVGQHMTLRPYVSLSYTYDSNVDSSKHSKAGSCWVVNPGLGAEYKSENWQISGNVWYQYHAYNHYVNQLNESSFGEDLAFKWTNSRPNERGWSLMVSEAFSQVAQDDDMTDHNGRGIGRDRKTFEVAGVLERRINEYWHAAADASYYWLDYDNNVDKYAPLYGWKRTVAGGEIGFAPSKWTDFILAGNYQWYTCDNCRDRYDYGGRYSRDSRGWTVMGGIATRATERISYRLLTGWSRFEFADATSKEDGWTYQLSGKWQLDDEGTWSTMALASSYYQPSEREYGSAIRVDSFSWGLAHSMVRGKLSATADVCYRREDHTYSYDGNAGDYTDDIFTGRLALNYSLNRFLQLFGSVEYQFDNCSGGEAGRRDYDYDRFRGTVGLRLTY